LRGGASGRQVDLRGLFWNQHMVTKQELENRAEAFSARGDMRSAARVCRDILALDEKHAPSLQFLADLALRSGNFPEAEAHLGSLMSVLPGDPQVHSQLGQALYRQGKLHQALMAYEGCWRCNPRNKLIYLTLGCLHLELDNIDKAAQVFSLGEGVDAEILSLWRHPKVNPAVANMSKKAWQTLCQHHTELHLAAVDTLDDAEHTLRIRNAVWPMLDAREVSYDHPLHQPQLFHIKHAESPTFFEGETFTWCEQLEAQFPAIREEVLARLDVQGDGKPYLSNRHALKGELWEPLVNKMSWASVHLYRGGSANPQVIDKYPRTLAALKSVPLATSGGSPAEVFISVLAPHTRIPEHFGVSSAILTVHLPIDVPPDCGLQVHRETRVPEEGRLMVFDDTWQHSAWNNSDRPRVVLIFEVWHSSLSEAERGAVLQSIQARKQWLRRRSVASMA
tara:strand:+ start:33331 stop:34680 length:1350 start_codon:yes stop_codon:yes gene_type:complete